MIVLNSRKHHQGLNNPTPFKTWSPKVDQTYRVFGATAIRFSATGDEIHNHIRADFEVFRDNPDGIWMPSTPYTHNTGWAHQ
eukprot:9157423-Heterocapsa_arctica.AAC.1